MIIIAGYSLTEAADRDAARDGRADVSTCMSVPTRSMRNGSMFSKGGPTRHRSMRGARSPIRVTSHAVAR
jgi:hypothetical protein